MSRQRNVISWIRGLTFGLLPIIAVAAIGFFSAPRAIAQFPGLLPSGNVWANAGASQGPAAPSTLTALLDRAFGTTNGTILARGASVWAATTLCAPQHSFLTSGTNATYTTPTCGGLLPARLELEMQGGGGGGGGSGTGPAAATAGNSTCWNTSGTACTAPIASSLGGGLGQTGTSGAASGGSTTGCNFGVAGGFGQQATTATAMPGGYGGSSHFGGGGPGGLNGGSGLAATAQSGSGGGGASSGGTANSGGGGAPGGYCLLTVTSPAASYVYTIGTGGGAGGAGTGGAAGGTGAGGIINATAYWQ